MHVPRGIRLALVDDHPTLLNGLAAIFSAEPGYEIVGTGSSADEAREIARANAIDVMLIDLSMPGDVFAAIAAISRADEKLKVVVFTAFANVELALRALDAGALGFVIKGRPTNDLFDAIEAVLAGELYASPEFAPSLFRGYRNRPRGDGTGPGSISRQRLDPLRRWFRRHSRLRL